MTPTPKSLAKYSKSIFKDETHLLVLAWLERTGETTEEALAMGIGKELDYTKRCLVDLHENGFVSYREETVRITEGGKEVLDRLGLAEQVVASVLSLLHVPLNYRTAMEHLLNQYRDSAYEYYLDTQASVSCYTAFHDVCHFSLAGSERSKNFRSVANLAIVFRDLRNWMRHSAEGLTARHAFSLSDTEHDKLQFLIQPQWDVSLVRSSHFHACAHLLAWCDGVNGTVEDTAEQLDREGHDMFEKMYLVFYDFQRRNERENWLKQWFKAFPDIEKAQRAPRLSSFYKIFLRIPATLFSKAGDWTNWWRKIPSTYLKPMIVEGSSVALGHLFTARSLSEFCELTGLDKEAATLLIRRISSKGHSLLNEI